MQENLENVFDKKKEFPPGDLGENFLTEFVILGPMLPFVVWKK